MERNEKIVICGAGGFIGGHLVKFLLKQGYTNIVAVDKKPLNQWYQLQVNLNNYVLDLSNSKNCYFILQGASNVFNLAADMGGMGFIEKNKALCMLSVLVNTNLLQASKDLGVSRYFFSSSACVYNASKQTVANITALKEEDAYPADPEDGYGWEKLFGERMCRHFREDFGIQTRIARYHNVYGPYGTYDGGREKAPAAICRKVIEGLLSGIHEIEIWGDGEQTRSFMYIDDCLKGTFDIFNSDWNQPINLGSQEMVTINQLVDIAESFAGIKLNRNYNLDAPKGVRGRNSDNTLINKVFNWEPSIKLVDGLKETYDWIFDEMTSGDQSRKVVNLY